MNKDRREFQEMFVMLFFDGLRNFLLLFLFFLFQNVPLVVSKRRTILLNVVLIKHELVI